MTAPQVVVVLYAHLVHVVLLVAVGSSPLLIDKSDPEGVVSELLLQNCCRH